MARTRIKICGLTRIEDVEGAVYAGADALGFVFYPPSPRFVSIEQAKVLMRNIPPFVNIVGLFVNADAAWIDTVLNTLPIQTLQFHGDETPGTCSQFGLTYIKAIHVKEGIDLNFSANEYKQAQGLLLDTYSTAYGGTGQTFDWQVIPTQLPCPLILSGGLNQENVRSAIETVHPWGVDVSSGVEVPGHKGIKDAERMLTFCRQVTQADAQQVI